MKLSRYQARVLLGACTFLCLAACGGQPAKDEPVADEPVPTGNYFMGARPIYGHLVSNKDGSWVFKTLTYSDEPPEKGFLVRMNDLDPAFDTRVAECVPQVYPESHRCNPANPFRDEDSGMLDKIINGGIAIGTAGQITDITYAYETTFDETDFNRAVDEALLNSDLDRRALISLVAVYEDEAQAARTEAAADTERLQALQDEATNVELDIQPTINGLVDYYENDIDFAQLVDLKLVEGVSLRDTESEIADVLPCEARRCVADVNNALADLRYSVRQNREQVAARMRPSSRAFDVRCDMVGYGGYMLKAECPAQIVVDGDRPMPLPIDVTILSRDFDRLYPEFDIVDRSLDIAIDGRSVAFSNTTNEYLTVTAQTVYYNSSVHTTTLSIEIPPGISVTRDLQEFVSREIDIESAYRQMTPGKASGVSFQFGFAVRYSLASRADEQTLHSRQTFNVGCVIENRIRPGSCQPEAMVDNADEADQDIIMELPLGPM